MRKGPGRKAAEPKGLGGAIFTRTQQRVLGLLFGESGRSFYASEIIRRAGAGSGAVQRELARLEAAGLITVRRVGSQKHLQANSDSPIFSELRSIIEKTVGLADPIRRALDPIAKKISAAFVFGSVAKGSDRSSSDIDLFILSDSISLGQVFALLEPVSATLHRTINPTILSRKEIARRRSSGNAFLTRVLSQPKIWVIGEEHDLAA
jgi:predicted nucleotidyltransferase